VPRSVPVDNLRPATQPETEIFDIAGCGEIGFSTIRNKSDEASKVAKYKTGMNPQTSRPACRGAALVQA
jgi:hypothetical protein